MDRETTAERLVRSLSFEVEAVPQDVVFASTKNSTPINVKIKVHRRDKLGALQQGILSVPKFGQSNGMPERIRLVSSDQTIMSFNVLMEADSEKKSVKKHRKHFFNIFKSGGCLNPEDEDDNYSYMPSTSNKENQFNDISGKSKSEISLQVSNGSASNKLTERDIAILGKCKPGGCLDPPFSEDKYSYKPSPLKHTTQLYNTQQNKKNSEVKQSPKRSSPPLDELHKRKKRKNSSLITTTAKEIHKEECKTGSTLNLDQSETVRTSLDTPLSNTIITYPLESSSTDLYKEISQKNLKNKFIEKSDETYFVPLINVSRQTRTINGSDKDTKNIVISEKLSSHNSLKKDANHSIKKDILQIMQEREGSKRQLLSEIADINPKITRQISRNDYLEPNDRQNSVNPNFTHHEELVQLLPSQEPKIDSLKHCPLVVEHSVTSLLNENLDKTIVLDSAQTISATPERQFVSLIPINLTNQSRSLVNGFKETVIKSTVKSQPTSSMESINKQSNCMLNEISNDNVINDDFKLNNRQTNRLNENILKEILCPDITRQMASNKWISDIEGKDIIALKNKRNLLNNEILSSEISYNVSSVGDGSQNTDDENLKTPVTKDRFPKVLNKTSSVCDKFDDNELHMKYSVDKPYNTEKFERKGHLLKINDTLNIGDSTLTSRDKISLKSDETKVTKILTKKLNDQNSVLPDTSITSKDLKEIVTTTDDDNIIDTDHLFEMYDNNERFEVNHRSISKKGEILYTPATKVSIINERTTGEDLKKHDNKEVVLRKKEPDVLKILDVDKDSLMDSYTENKVHEDISSVSGKKNFIHTDKSTETLSLMSSKTINEISDCKNDNKNSVKMMKSLVLPDTMSIKSDTGHDSIKKFYSYKMEDLLHNNQVFIQNNDLSPKSNKILDKEKIVENHDSDGYEGSVLISKRDEILDINELNERVSLTTNITIDEFASKHDKSNVNKTNIETDISNIINIKSQTQDDNNQKFSLHKREDLLLVNEIIIQEDDLSPERRKISDKEDLIEKYSIHKYVNSGLISKIKEMSNVGTSNLTVSLHADKTIEEDLSKHDKKYTVIANTERMDLTEINADPNACKDRVKEMTLSSKESLFSNNDTSQKKEIKEKNKNYNNKLMEEPMNSFTKYSSTIIFEVIDKEQSINKNVNKKENEEKGFISSKNILHSDETIITTSIPANKTIEEDAVQLDKSSVLKANNEFDVQSASNLESTKEYNNVNRIPLPKLEESFHLDNSTKLKRDGIQKNEISDFNVRENLSLMNSKIIDNFSTLAVPANKAIEEYAGQIDEPGIIKIKKQFSEQITKSFESNKQYEGVKRVPLHNMEEPLPNSSTNLQRGGILDNEKSDFNGSENLELIDSKNNFTLNLLTVPLTTSKAVDDNANDLNKTDVMKIKNASDVQCTMSNKSNNEHDNSERKPLHKMQESFILSSAKLQVDGIQEKEKSDLNEREYLKLKDSKNVFKDNTSTAPLPANIALEEDSNQFDKQGIIKIKNKSYDQSVMSFGSSKEYDSEKIMSLRKTKESLLNSSVKLQVDGIQDIEKKNFNGKDYLKLMDSKNTFTYKLSTASFPISKAVEEDANQVDKPRTIKVKNESGVQSAISLGSFKEHDSILYAVLHKMEESLLENSAKLQIDGVQENKKSNYNEREHLKLMDSNNALTGNLSITPFPASKAVDEDASQLDKPSIIKLRNESDVQNAMSFESNDEYDSIKRMPLRKLELSLLSSSAKLQVGGIQKIEERSFNDMDNFKLMDSKNIFTNNLSTKTSEAVSFSTKNFIKRDIDNIDFKISKTASIQLEVDGDFIKKSTDIGLQTNVPSNDSEKSLSKSILTKIHINPNDGRINSNNENQEMLEILNPTQSFSKDFENNCNNYFERACQDCDSSQNTQVIADTLKEISHPSIPQNKTLKPDKHIYSSATDIELIQVLNKSTITNKMISSISQLDKNQLPMFNEKDFKDTPGVIKESLNVKLPFERNNISNHYAVNQASDSFNESQNIDNRLMSHKPRTDKKLIDEGNIILNLAFQWNFKENNMKELKSLNMEKDLNKRINDNITTVKCVMNPNENGLLIPIDSENDLSINISKKSNAPSHKLDELKLEKIHDLDTSLQANKVTRTNIKSFGPVAYESNLVTNAVIGERTLPNVLTLLYEEELIPLRDVIMSLKKEIDDLIKQKELFMETNYAKRTKSKRLIHTNKKCNCSKK